MTLQPMRSKLLKKIDFNPKISAEDPAHAGFFVSGRLNPTLLLARPHPNPSPGGRGAKYMSM
jgi:hypothetical protein